MAENISIMDGKIQELTTKIYKEGVEKAKQEAKEIIDNANTQKETILKNAKQEAEEIINNAKKEAEQLKNRVLSEVKMASNQSIATLKQEITNLLSKLSISDTLTKTFNDIEFIKELIKELINKWDSSLKVLDIELVLPEKNKKELEEFFKTKLKDILNKGLEISFESRMKQGFRIGPKDKSFVLSFTDSDFIDFFQSFLKPKTKEILFGE